MAFEKSTTVEKYRTHDTDSGSTRVQIALLSERIKYLTDTSAPTRRTTTAAVVFSR